MTMPKFEPVAEVLWYDPELRMTPEPAGKIIDSSMSFIESAAIGTPLYTADQLTESYEAGKRDAIPEGWVLVPKDSQWFLEFVREWDHFKHMGVSWIDKFYRAMLAAAPKGEE